MQKNQLNSSSKKSHRTGSTRGTRTTRDSRPSCTISVEGAGELRGILGDLTRDLPGAYGRTMKAEFNITQSSDGVILSGRDLVVPLPVAVAVNSQLNLFVCIPANPCYWLGTRIAALAAAYQNYRPLVMIFHYIPQVAVTQAGTVLVGTTWNSPMASESIEQSLVTSNGGAMSQCYVPFSTSVTLGSNLPQNLFTCAGPIDEDHNPFMFLAMMRGGDVVPGYFFVEYKFALKNPLGEAIAYDYSLTTAPEYGSVRLNRSIVTLGTVLGLAGPGLVLDVEADGQAYHKGTLVDVPSGTRILLLACTPISVVDPVYVSELQSIVVLPQEAATGSSVNLQPDRALWNWETDGNSSAGAFRPAGSTPVSFESTLTSVRIWVENAAQGLQLFVYALDLATATVGAFVGAYKILSGTASDPSIVLSVSPRPTRTTVTRGWSSTRNCTTKPREEKTFFFSEDKS